MHTSLFALTTHFLGTPLLIVRGIAETADCPPAHLRQVATVMLSRNPRACATEICDIAARRFERAKYLRKVRRVRRERAQMMEWD